jgi:hypothetical protein
MPTKKLEREDWLRHAKAWKKSGLSCADYSEREGLKPSTLSWWTWKLRGAGARIPGAKKTRGRAAEGKKKASNSSKPERTRAKKARSVSFVELAPVSLSGHDPAVASSLELELGGVIVRVRATFDEAQLARVLDVLEARR